MAMRKQLGTLQNIKQKQKNLESMKLFFVLFFAPRRERQLGDNGANVDNRHNVATEDNGATEDNVDNRHNVDNGSGMAAKVRLVLPWRIQSFTLRLSRIQASA